MNKLHIDMNQQFGTQATKSLLGNRLRFGLFFAAVCLSGCASMFESQKPAPVPVAIVPAAPPPAPTSLNAEAASTLKAAEQSVIEARVKRVLWSAAIEQLTEARKAAKIFDSETTLRHAKEVIALCELSGKQAQLPPVVW
jgi:hypothetical protein